MNRRLSSLTLGAVALSGSLLSAQITLINNSTFGSRYATTTGVAHSLDTAQKQIGFASVRRAAGASNASFLSTGIELDPASNSFTCGAANNGYTIQFWYRPAAPATFSYLWGDRDWTGASGAFRCFQNGAAGAGNLFARGPLGQLTTTGAPLTSMTNPAGWVHFALVQDNTAGSLTWYVNGAPNATVASTGTTKGRNFTCMGYNGSASAGAEGNYDDFRVYNWARSAADIAADYQVAATGVGPSGCLNIPDHGYYNCDAAVTPHQATINLGNEPADTVTRLFTTGDTIEFSASTPATGPYAAFLLVNVFVGGPGSPRQDAYGAPPPLPGGPYVTSFIPGLELGGSFSNPTYAASLLWPTTVSYGGATVGKITVPNVPNIGLVPGDRVDAQFVVGDPSYPPIGLGTTNNLTFEYVDVGAATGVHVEARGVDRIQDTGFWEVWNTGLFAIQEVSIDFSTIPAGGVTWDPAGGLNSGGTLQAGTSFRFNTDVICDLTPAGNPRYTLNASREELTFKFTPPPAPANGFQGPTNHFIFDSDTVGGGAGSAYIGATVKVTFVNNTTVTGTLIADPSDPNAAQIDL